MRAAGSSIDRRYQIVRALGEGLSGEVYLVAGPGGESALKLLKPFSDRALEESLLAAFKFEFGLLKDFNHPNVVQIRDFGFDPELQRFYFTEEFLPGSNIAEFCAGRDPKDIEALFVQALHGLQALHRAHILHGDLQANNLMVIAGDRGAALKIIDLGLSDPRFPFTAGTPSTMPPEKILKDPASGRSDLYSLGVIFYALLAGENPFVRESIQSTYQAHLSFHPPPLTLKNAKIPVYWNEILAHLLAKNPEHRYRSCADVLEALEFSRPRHRDRAASSPWNPETWTLRPEVLKGVADRLHAEAKGKTGACAFLLCGEPGVGKSRLLQELKYQIQMEGLRTFESRRGGLSPESAAPDLWIVDDWPSYSAQDRQVVLKNAAQAQALLLLGSDPDSVPDLQQEAERGGFKVEVAQIPAFSRADVARFLAKATGCQEIPESFLSGVWEKSGGNPRRIVGLLQNLAKQGRLADEHGRWNLAIFKEGDADLQAPSMELPEIERALERTSPGDDAAKAELWLQRAEEELKRNQGDAAASSLAEAETICRRIGDLRKKFHLKARVLDRNAYRLIREGRLESARQYWQQALTLLEEGGTDDPVLAIRVQNFLAWLACHEGKVDEAIRIFLEQRERARSLPPRDQAEVLNNDLGFAYLQKGDADRAIASLRESLELFESVGDPPSLLKARYNLAEAHCLKKEYAAAIEHYQAGAELARQERNYEFLLRIYNGLGKTQHLLADLPAALGHYRRALDLARYLKEYSSAAAIAQNIGSIQKDNGEERDAEENFAMSLKMLAQLKEKSSHDRYLQCRALLEWGDLERIRRRFDEALGRTREAHQLAFAEDALQPFRFWVVHTLCQIEMDRGREDALRERLAELLPLADDAEKLAACEPFRAWIPDSKKEKPMIDQTRREDYAAAGGETSDLKALIQVTRWLAEERDPESLLKNIARLAVELSRAEAGWILLKEADDSLKVAAACNLNVDEQLRMMSEGVVREVLSSGEALASGNAVADPRFNVYQSVVAQHFQSILAIPIRSGSRVLGVLALTHRHRGDLFAPARRDLLQAFADQGGFALEQARLIAELQAAREQLSQKLCETEDALDESRRRLSEASLVARFQNAELIGRDPKMLELFDLVERVKNTPLAVLLRGESGTGKERIARFIHENGRRSKQRFVAVNCAALPANLIESELFGHKAGAFTGANRDKKGLIAEADGGTLFLDEIAELDVALQAKLLRVLQEKEITRLGDTRPTPVDFRLISATHQDLQARIRDGRFREDLFYRICEIELVIPPLRERSGDLAALAEAFTRQYLEEHGESAKVKIGRDLLKAMLEHRWPGNIRELENVVRVAVALRRGGTLQWDDLPRSLQQQLGAKPEVSSKPPASPALERSVASGKEKQASFFDPDQTWEEIEVRLIAKALMHHAFDVPRTAKALGCAPSKLYQRLREHRMQENQAEWQGRGGAYRPDQSLEQVKSEVFREAFRHFGESPYETARRLQVSPGMVYKWTTNLPQNRGR